MLDKDRQPAPVRSHALQHHAHRCVNLLNFDTSMAYQPACELVFKGRTPEGGGGGLTKAVAQKTTQALLI